MMEGTRIIKLSPEQNVTSVTFEEAFGEYSEARGRGAQRRAERRERRQEKKMQRIANKNERKSAKQQNRQQRRTNKMEMRQDRRINRKTLRMQRKDIGRENEQVDENSTLPNEQEQSETAMNQQDTSASQQGGGGYSEEQGGGSQEQGGGYAEDEQQGGYSEDEGSDEGAEDGSDEGEDMEGFNAEGDREVTDTSDIKVHPRILDTTRKIEWNHGMVERLKHWRNKALKAGMNSSNFDATIRQHNDRIAELEESLSGFCEAAGGRSAAHRRNAKAQIARGREIARGERMKAIHSAKARKMAKHQDNGVGNGGDVTQIDKELNPEIQNNRIEVPASSNFDAADYSPEKSSNASGANDYKAKRSINVTHVAIGVGVAALAIWAIRKYKLI